MENENAKPSIYDDNFVENLFDRMSKTYGTVNYISSFGFTERWRQQCVDEIDWTVAMKEGYDLMSGMGESWHLIMKNKKVRLTGVDMSFAMNKKAKEKIEARKDWDVRVKEENILANSIESDTADFIVSTFGIKTFSLDKQKLLAREINRILKPGGQIAMIEVSVPNQPVLKMLFLFYLKRVIPIIGRLFMGNSLDYSMLGVYCERFKNCEQFSLLLAENGMDVKVKPYFFGCATGIVGRKK